MKSYIKERNIIVYLLLSILTCGLYSLIVFFMFGCELRDEARRHQVRTIPFHPLLAGTGGILNIYYGAEIAKKINGSAAYGV